MNQQFYKNMAVWVVILVMILLMLTMFRQGEQVPPEKDYSEFLALVEQGQVQKVVMEEGYIRGETKDGSFSTYAPTVTEGMPKNRVLNLLLVEDNEDAARSMAMLLRLRGHEVRVCRDGFAALKAAAEEAPQVVILDIGLPVLNGYEVARRLRELPSLSKTLIIALTGYGQDEDRRRSREAGIDTHLVKPVELEDLQRALASFHPEERVDDERIGRAPSP